MGTHAKCPSSFVPSAITRSFFELQTPDFAWKFVWTVRKNTRNTRNTINTRKYQKIPKMPEISEISDITRSFFELRTPDFAWKFVWTVRTNTRNTRKYQKIPENTRKYQKYQKYQKIP